MSASKASPRLLSLLNIGIAGLSMTSIQYGKATTLFYVGYIAPCAAVLLAIGGVVVLDAVKPYAWGRLSFIPE